MIFRPGMIVEVTDTGWTYPTYVGISEHYGLKNWKSTANPSKGIKYKVLHYISSESAFGQNGEKVLLEDIEPPHHQFIVGVDGVKIVEATEFKEDSEVIEKNKAEKPSIYFDFNSI